MTQGDVVYIAQSALVTVIKLAAPMLGFGVLVGLIVSIFQATTQIQEQTLAFVPKILAVFAALIVMGSWMLTVLIDFTRRIYTSILDYL